MAGESEIRSQGNVINELFDLYIKVDGKLQVAKIHSICYSSNTSELKHLRPQNTDVTKPVPPLNHLICI